VLEKCKFIFLQFFVSPLVDSVLPYMTPGTKGLTHFIYIFHLSTFVRDTEQGHLCIFHIDFAND
jgi:hypothetical protein